MSGFLAELGKKLAEKWVSLLALPGALYLGVLLVGRTLGHAHFADLPLLTTRITENGANLQRHGAVAVGMLTVATILGATSVGLAAQGLSELVQRVWMGEPLLRIDRRHDDVRRRSTWMARRINELDARVRQAYSLDLASAWPRLWLVMPEATRAELDRARTAYDRAAVLCAWGVLYLIIAIWWWPALVITVVVTIAGWLRGRAAIEHLTELAEASVDVYLIDLATALRLAPASGELPKPTGRDLTERFRKGG